MKNSLYPENKMEVAEKLRKTLNKTLNENFLQKNIRTDNKDMIITYKGDRAFEVVITIKS